MDSLWRDATNDGWELEPGASHLERHEVGSPLRDGDASSLEAGAEVLLLVVVAQPGGGEPVKDSFWVEVVGTRRPYSGRVITGPRQSYCPGLNENQEVTFLPEHVAGIRRAPST